MLLDALAHLRDLPVVLLIVSREDQSSCQGLITEKKLDDLRSPLRFLLGHTELAKELRGLSVTLVNLDGQTGYTLWGTPIGMEQRVRSLAVTVDAQGVIHALRIEETDGAVTTFTFSEMHENSPVTDGDFRFIPPEGVTVIDGAAPV